MEAGAASITVAVATSGRPEELARCLRALARQTLAPHELLVVDQGDGTPLRPDLLPGIRFVHCRQRRVGLSASRNAAVTCASSEIVAFTDDDCVPDTNWLRAVAAAFARNGSLAGVGGRVLPLPSEHADVRPVSSRVSEVAREYASTHRPWDVATGGNFAARREWLLRIGGFDERLGAGSRGRAAEDIDVVHSLLRAGGRIRYEPAAIVYHEQQEEARWRSSRGGYGLGIGAFVGVRARAGHAAVGPLLLRWLAMRGRLAAVAARDGDGARVAAEGRVLAGTARGIAYGLLTRAPRRGPLELLPPEGSQEMHDPKPDGGRGVRG